MIAVFRALLAPAPKAAPAVEPTYDTPQWRATQRAYAHEETFTVPTAKVQEAKAIIAQEGGHIVSSGPVPEGYQMTVAY